MYAKAEVAEQYKQAVRQLLKFPRVAYHKGRVSGLGAALDCLGVNSDERREIRETCEEGVLDERAQEDVGPGDVNYDEEGFVIEQDHKRLQPELEQQAEQEELDAVERPASQARVQEANR